MRTSLPHAAAAGDVPRAAVLLLLRPPPAHRRPSRAVATTCLPRTRSLLTRRHAADRDLGMLLLLSRSSTSRCGSNCKCGKMYPDLDEQASTTTQAVVVVGVAHENKAGKFEMAAGESGEGCKCGANCKCDPCNC